MSGKTPNFFRPDSASKFVRPRSQQKSTKRQDFNSTAFGPGGTSAFNSTTRSLNSTTVRRNLDITLRAGPPIIKSKFGPAAVDNDLELSLDYNEYLQTLMKNQIVRKTSQGHTSVLDNQIFIQSENLYTLKQNLQDIQNKIEHLKVQGEVVEILDFLSDNITDFNVILEKLGTKKSAASLCDILTEESNLVKLNNIKPIESQEEYDKLMENVSNLVATLGKVLNSGRNFDGISRLGEEIIKFNELKKKVQYFQKKIDESRKEITVSLIHSASNMFASIGGYE